MVVVKMVGMKMKIMRENNYGVMKLIKVVGSKGMLMMGEMIMRVIVVVTTMADLPAVSSITVKPRFLAFCSSLQNEFFKKCDLTASLD